MLNTCWLAVRISTLQRSHKWESPPRCLIDESAYQLVQSTSPAHLSIIPLGGHSPSWHHKWVNSRNGFVSLYLFPLLPDSCTTWARCSPTPPPRPCAARWPTPATAWRRTWRAAGAPPSPASTWYARPPSCLSPSKRTQSDSEHRQEVWSRLYWPCS